MTRLQRPGKIHSANGFLDVLKIALPLILANSCHAANMFMDRLMLAQYSQDAVAAAFTGGLTNFTLSCVFVGTIGYTGTFVAQYEGAGHRERIGSAMWQGVWMALIGGGLFFSSYWWIAPVFRYFNHEPSVLVQEIQYYRVLTVGTFAFLLNCVLPCFWTGRGKTYFVLEVSVLITLCNIPLNYLFIFGKYGFPELGIRGAAYGTILADVIGLVIYCCVFFAPSARRHFCTANYKLEPELMLRMLKYGLPSGVNLSLDLIAFNIFSLLLGCYGVNVLEAASITFGINNVAFCPVIGVGVAASILVGQAIGAENVPLAKRAVKSCILLSLFYNALMILLFTVFQKIVLNPFIREGDPSQLETIQLARYMLYFISTYLLFDSFNIILQNSLRGAGDTKFTMYAMILAGLLLFALPCILLFRLNAPWWTLWCAMVTEIMMLALIFVIRYRGGKWTRMRVIEVSAIKEVQPS